ncbi:hypothetical protein K437DRAFT_237610 [Tilletiaria anomala UBC 951]|uniref:tRNA-intron lyase n=1 Tax=Tilletiaria anomala (strain ATCC 24038 / CBS 436.72 / UBC 951) TaxID=1037660 RepID=A0A066VLH3_TILAU|nr:uncharacterized protein K437DRAFT_237610 [Tilletiaria anomala UBC 951]KDN42597.1 hypothetical protein K437DRAFT_237610 [Tilletiaria anomala UBC 951]
MPRGYQKKPQRRPGTALPSGQVQPADWAADAGRANTGKAGAANKVKLYRHPLPLHFVPRDDEREWNEKEQRELERRRAKARAIAMRNAAHATGANVDEKGKAKQVERQGESWAQWLSLFIPSFLSTRGQHTASNATSENVSNAEPTGSSSPLIVTGHFDPLTCSVWVTCPESATLLWRRGFFGKGSLSRSEPTWRERQVHTRTILAQRARAEAVASAGAVAAGARATPLTAEELTAIRRRERQVAKIERAKAAVRAGTQLPDGIIALGGSLDADELEEIMRKVQVHDAAPAGVVDGGGGSDVAAGAGETEDDGYRGQHVPGLIYFRQPASKGPAQAQVQQEPCAREGDKPTTAKANDPVSASSPGASSATADDAAMSSSQTSKQHDLAKQDRTKQGAVVQEEEVGAEESINVDVDEVEFVQLSMVEAFFLAAMLGVLQVKDQEECVLDLDTLYMLCLAAHPQFAHCAHPSLRDLPLSEPSALLRSSSPAQLALLRRPDNPFLLAYVAYHYFRSLGWVVKSGTKFCVDYLLYKRGPVFGHAEFAVLVIPSYDEDEGEAQQETERPADDGEAARGRDVFGIKESGGGGGATTGVMDWVRFSSVNRVNTQVLKTLLLCYVSVPSVQRSSAEGVVDTPAALVRGLRQGRSFRVQVVAVRRWVPARMKA